MEPGGTLEERADVTRKKLLNYIKFRREEERMKFKIGVKGRKAQIPGAGDWNSGAGDDDDLDGDYDDVFSASNSNVCI